MFGEIVNYPISITMFTYPQILQGQALCRAKNVDLTSHVTKSKLRTTRTDML